MLTTMNGAEGTRRTIRLARKPFSPTSRMNRRTPLAGEPLQHPAPAARPR
jgi:hypothetical protein